MAKLNNQARTTDQNKGILEVLEGINDELQPESKGSVGGEGSNDGETKAITRPVEELPQSPLTDPRLIAARQRYQTVKPKRLATKTQFHRAMAANPFGKE